uniref:Terpene synthase N-terminal domain-containing protein n=1 Tax=Physcomitrium patens TaxID=3218 RepID=A0A2K1JW91_PHYPA|nr:hypothetical protein PHYPA_015573 [Physcomitrium patens]
MIYNSLSIPAHRYWKDYGIGWASNSAQQDVDETAMVFPLLLKPGFHIKEVCLRQYYKDGEFLDSGTSSIAVTGMFNLSRASQMLGPGETLLKKAWTFTRSFLKEKLESNKCFYKWIITKDLAGEKNFRETSLGKLSGVHYCMHDHLEVTSEAAAVAHMQEMVDNYMQQLTYELLRFTAVPKSCKRIVFDAARIV